MASFVCSFVLGGVVCWGWWFGGGVRRSVSGVLAPAPTLAEALPVESTIAENVLSSHVGDNNNTPRLTTECTPGEGLSARRDPDFLVSANSPRITVPQGKASTLVFVSLPLVASSNSLTASLWVPSSLRAKLLVGDPDHTLEESYF